MWRTVTIFGICLAILLALLKWFEFRFFAGDMRLEIYVGLVGMVCILLGGWMGWKLTRPKAHLPNNENNLNGSGSMAYDPENGFGLSRREYEVLIQIAQGHSYQEIADNLSVSLSTVKTHSANIFSKMDVKRRTQAVMLAQQQGLIPPANV